MVRGAASTDHEVVVEVHVGVGVASCDVARELEHELARVEVERVVTVERGHLVRSLDDVDPRSEQVELARACLRGRHGSPSGWSSAVMTAGA